MNSILKKLRDEPVAVAALVEAVLALIVAFGLELTTAQNLAILGVTGAFLALFARSKVAPVAALNELAEDAADGHQPPLF